MIYQSPKQDQTITFPAIADRTFGAAKDGQSPEQRFMVRAARPDGRWRMEIRGIVVEELRLEIPWVLDVDRPRTSALGDDHGVAHHFRHQVVRRNLGG